MHKKIEYIESLLNKAMLFERNVAEHEIRLIKNKNHFDVNKNNKNLSKRLYSIEKKLKRSVQKRIWRKENRPLLFYDSDLPITKKKDQIIESIKYNQVVIISGETGSGKSTQIPKYCIAADRGIYGLIGCTQPRRIAAITIANRIAEELETHCGEAVGYKIRFKDKTNYNTFIKIMTDGILLAETQLDPYFFQYDTIIIDEAHERSLNIDFILGILKTLLSKRKELKLVITSATIDTEKFSKAFNNAPLIEVSGQMYPVSVHYINKEVKEDTMQKEGDEQNHVEMAADAVDKIQRTSSYGDILIFMPTQQDIKETCELIESKHYHNIKLLPLFARLASSEQTKIFAKYSGRKIVVATNIAETSITIPGIKYVIDTGLARISQYSPKSRITSLPVMPVAKSSADQRKGRCGRVENGVCIRLFSEEDYNLRSCFTKPEILRANLAEVVLKMLALNIQDISDFPLIDKPSLKNINDGFAILTELGAIKPCTGNRNNKKHKRYFLSSKGKIMARMPIDPRLSAIIIEAQKQGCLNEIIIIIAGLSITDPRERPIEKEKAADQMHAYFVDASSDYITILNIWTKYNCFLVEEKSVRNRAKLARKFCKKHYLSYKKMREWEDVCSQIFLICKQCGIKGSEYLPGNKKIQKKNDVKKIQIKSDLKQVNPLLYNVIHRSILSGFLSNIAVKKEKNIYNAAKGKKVMIFPGSVLFNNAGEWIVAAEFIETSRIYAKTVANIDNKYLEVIGKSLCKYSYMDPHWERKRGEVVVSEQVSLFGLVIISSRKISFGKIDPDKATDIFIQHALVQGDVRNPFEFMKHNQKLIDEVKSMENKIRKKNLLVSEHDLFMFYKTRIKKAYNLKLLKQDIKKKGNDDYLKMGKENLFLYSPDQEKLSLFPDKISLGDNDYNCDYKFEPGKSVDGVTVTVPLSNVSDISLASVDRIVPGFFREKITALAKGLPKNYRKQLFPISNTVDIILKELHVRQGDLLTDLGKVIYNHFGISIPHAAWSEDDLPEYLKMRLSIISKEGKQCYAGRDKSALKSRFDGFVADSENDKIDALKKKWEKHGITSWEFEHLPEYILINGEKNINIKLYPGLKVCESCDKSVNLKLFKKQNEAVKCHMQGVKMLYQIYFSKEIKWLKKNLCLENDMKNKANYFGGAKIVEQDIYDKIVKIFFSKNIRSYESFFSHARSTSSAFQQEGIELQKNVVSVLDAYHKVRSEIYRLELENKKDKIATQAADNLRNELQMLMPESFISYYETDRYKHIVRYIKALGIRAQRAFNDFKKDQLKAEEITLFTDSQKMLANDLSSMMSKDKIDAIMEYFWLIEEYKVSVFAQELKTPFPVSKKKLENKLMEIKKMG